MRVAVKSHALPVYMKNKIVSLQCIFETTIYNCITMRYYLSKDTKHIIQPLKRQQNTCIRKCLFNISKKAKSVDPDQSDLGPHCLSKRLQIFQRSTKTYDIL